MHDVYVDTSTSSIGELEPTDKQTAVHVLVSIYIDMQQEI